MQIKDVFVSTKCGIYCSKKRLKFEHDDPQQFVKSQWQQSSRCYIFLVYRWMLAVFFIGAFICSLLNHISKYNESSKFFIYLTIWGFILSVIYSVLAAIATTWYFQPAQLETIETTENMPMILRVIWILHSVSLTLSVVITLVYWTLLYNKDKAQMDAKNILTHICNSIVMFLDLMIVAHPIYLVHVLYTILFGTVYAMFSMIYQLAGGLNVHEEPYIYSIMDWEKPQKAIVVFFGVLFLATCIHCLLWLVCRVRIKVFELFNQKSPLEANNNLECAMTDIYVKYSSC